MIVRLDWNEYLERWIVKKPKGSNIYELPDCDNFNLIFPELDKEKSNFYEITATKKGNDYEW